MNNYICIDDIAKENNDDMNIGPTQEVVKNKDEIV